MMPMQIKFASSCLGDSLVALEGKHHWLPRVFVFSPSDHGFRGNSTQRDKPQVTERAGVGAGGGTLTLSKWDGKVYIPMFPILLSN
jgi:hypothetical protein